MGDLDEALRCSKDVVELRKRAVPMVLALVKERMDLELKHLQDLGDQLVSSGSRVYPEPTYEALEKRVPKLPEITSWTPPFEVNQMFSDIEELKKITTDYRGSRRSAGLS